MPISRRSSVRRTYILGAFLGHILVQKGTVLFIHMMIVISNYNAICCSYRRQAKKQFHFESNQQTCLTTYMQFLIPLRNKICETLNIEEITVSLSSNPDNKLELWEHLKVLGFTRTMTSVVSMCSLYVFLKVQMNIIAGYMYTETIADAGNEEIEKVKELLHEIEMDQPVSSLQKEYLKNVTFLFEDGIMLLINDIKQLVIGKISILSLLDNSMTKLVVTSVSAVLYTFNVM